MVNCSAESLFWVLIEKAYYNPKLEHFLIVINETFCVKIHYQVWWQNKNRYIQNFERKDRLLSNNSPAEKQ